MDVTDNPPGYSMAYILIVVFTVGALIFFQPPRPKIVKKYLPAVTDRKFRDKRTVDDKKDAKKDTVSQKTETVKKKIPTPAEKLSEKTNKVLTNIEYFKMLSERYKKETLSAINHPGSRTDMVIRYYKKQKDENRVYKLRELGYYVHERPSEVTYSKFGSNAIFYGDSVSNQDIQMIAYTLIEAGLEIQKISLSKFHDTWKAHSVEIGTDTTISGLPKIILADLRNNWPLKD